MRVQLPWQQQWQVLQSVQLLRVLVQPSGQHMPALAVTCRVCRSSGWLTTRLQQQVGIVTVTSC